MADKVTMRERILASALKLFSEKGYDAVSVDQIASAVGIKGPALYNHFKGKENLLNSLAEVIEQHYQAHIARCEKFLGEAATPEALITASHERFTFELQDPVMIRIRRLVYLEQFRSPRFARLATEHLYQAQSRMYAEIFRTWIDKGFFREEDPSEMALAYVAPVSILMQICDREPERAPEILDKLQRHVVSFMNLHALPQKELE